MKIVLYFLLSVVAAAAAVLSFSALRDLALVCGFDDRLAWLLPVVVDAGAAAGSIVWLSDVAPTARKYGRTLSIALLASSVGGNTVGHILAAFHLAPAWWVVAGLSAVAPIVVLAVVHLIVLARRPVAPTGTTAEVVAPTAEVPEVEPETVQQLVGRFTVVPPPDEQLSDEQIAAAARDWAVDLKRLPTWTEMQKRYAIGAGRCKRVRQQLGWVEDASA